MCHAARLKHVLAMAEMGNGGIQNGPSIGLVDFQPNTKLIDSPFKLAHAKLHAIMVFASLLDPVF